MNSLPVPPSGGSPGDGPSGEARGPDQRLGRSRRLTRSSCFQEAFAQQRKWVGRTMVLWLRSGDDAALRLGVVSSRKVGGAVQRTRARRLLRDVFRRNRHRLTGPVDVVLVARAAILRAPPAAREADFLSLARAAGIMADL
ncbi:MAG TPA: ribonuclease P protein component [Kiritimatiellia bacterium]|nr:ribonuclease P protein component [Kiritimatiellia bacterium]HMO97638.1 ribonuclease P protein component [Kiritimatiellia bacterium]HMP97434.1 ribonuclease P protein component [Kiritimatiellia bacterium]